MTQITSLILRGYANDIPDELAQRLAPFQSQFSDLFTRLIATTLLEQTTPDPTPANNSILLHRGYANDTSGTYQEILDFLIDRPTAAQIINFKVSAASQLRLQTLLQKNREIALTADETAEINLYQQLDTLIGFLKVRAYAALQATPQN
jgi:hypothetical protein